MRVRSMQAPAETVAQLGETSPLVIEPQAPTLEPGLQHSILFAEERD